MGSLSSKRNQSSKFLIYRPCLLDLRTGKAPHLSQRSAVDQKERAAQLSAEKQWGWGVGVWGCVCITLAPHYL
jgi:hypothetical protein